MIYVDISEKTNKVANDQFAEFLSQIKIEISGFGQWRQTDIASLMNFMIVDYEIVYITKGATRITLNGITTDCPAGTLVLFEPFVSCSAQCLPGELVEYYYIHFDIAPVYLQERFRTIVFGHDNTIEPDSGVDFTQAFKQIDRDIAAKKEGSSTLLFATMLHILVFAMRKKALWKSQGRELTFHDRELAVINLTIEYISQNIQRSIKISELSRHLGVSESYLYRIFIKITGASPSQYIARYKVKKAEQMLKANTFSIQEIAQMLGYSSVYHFSKSFKDIFQVSPSNYRKQCLDRLE